jgi:hypothetical protein
MLAEIGLLHFAVAELPEEHTSVIFFDYPLCKDGSRLPYQVYIGVFTRGKWLVRGVPSYPKDLNGEHEVKTWAYISQ